ncbi:transcriptional activator domain protein [Arthrobacter sp. MSA 4-2]|nr:transcriptional activator domain protein [Arthrobacter sp. MSA 4-2]
MTGPHDAERGPVLIVRSKIETPPVTERLIARARLTDRILGLMRSHRIVCITATAGAGKTTAAIQALEEQERPVVWITLDSTDRAPGRLLLYLESAFANEAPHLRGLVTNVLAAGLGHEEATGLLVEAVAGEPLVLVLDGLEQLAGAEESISLVRAIARYAPRTLKVLLLSRLDVPLDVGSDVGVDQVATVGESQLAFNTDEAADALAQYGMLDIDPARAVESTGGWVTGILFEAWRAREHVVGTGGEADPLHGYLASQILARLTAEERDFLITTSMLEEVTAARAEKLGEVGAGERLKGLYAQHLPVSWRAGSASMRCHPRFREYLLTLLRRRDGEDLRSLRLVFADLMRAEGNFEECVEQLLLAGALDDAVEPAGRAIIGVIARLDYPVAKKWLRILASAKDSQTSELAVGELMLAIADDDYARGCSVADRLESAGARRQLAATSPTGASIMAWCYWHLGRVDEMKAVLTSAPRSPEVDAASYLLSLSALKPEPAGLTVPRLTGGPLDAVIMRTHYVRGRLREANQQNPSPWAAAVSTPWKAATLRATGHLEQALNLYRSYSPEARSQAWMHGVAGPEIMVDLADEAEARRILAHGRDLIKASGSLVMEWLNLLVEAKLELRVSHNVNAAGEILDRVENSGGRSYAFIGESVDTAWGLLFLMSAPDEGRAVQVLQRAVDSMQEGHRILELPAAAAYLAEAEWRRGHEAESDAASDLALAAAAEQGSNHQLLLALSDFQGVVSRRLDAERGVDSRWHELGRALRKRGVPVDRQARPVISLSEFGSLRILVEGEESRPRLARSATLLAYLATVPGYRATREELLEALFDGRTDESSRAYLRQITHRLREVLPAGTGPSFSADLLAFHIPVIIDSESAQFLSLLSEAARLTGSEMLETLLRALSIVDRGEYLPNVDFPWARQRREYLEDQVVQARLQAGLLAFDQEHYEQAASLAEQVVARDPFKEGAWRLLMHTASALGDNDQITTYFKRCAEALNELEVLPSDSTRLLFERLRR